MSTNAIDMIILLIEFIGIPSLIIVICDLISLILRGKHFDE